MPLFLFSRHVEPSDKWQRGREVGPAAGRTDCPPDPSRRKITSHVQLYTVETLADC